MLNFISKRHEHIICKQSLSIFITINLFQLIRCRKHISSNNKPIILLFGPIKESYIRIEPLMNDSIRLVIEYKLNSMFIVPFLWVEVKLWVYFLMDFVLYFLVNILWDFLVFVFQLEIYKRFVKHVLSVRVIRVLKHHWYLAVKSILTKTINTADCRAVVLAQNQNFSLICIVSRSCFGVDSLWNLFWIT